MTTQNPEEYSPGSVRPITGPVAFSTVGTLPTLSPGELAAFFLSGTLGRAVHAARWLLTPIAYIALR